MVVILNLVNYNVKINKNRGENRENNKREKKS